MTLTNIKIMYELFTITMLRYALLHSNDSKRILQEESQNKYTSDAVMLMLPLTEHNASME